KCKRLVVSGPLPTIYRGDVVYSKWCSLKCWLLTRCAAKHFEFVNNLETEGFLIGMVCIPTGGDLIPLPERKEFWKEVVNVTSGPLP
ncbi:hypothetical protein GN956_G7250, partial [Arapaima gigas]